MRDTNGNKLPRQAFQAHSSPDSPPLSKNPVDISARWDSRMNQHIILWTDIKHVFKNAAYILSDGVAVPFMTDDDFNELKPLRICCQPGVVFSVFPENMDQGSDIPTITLSATEVHTSLDEVDGTTTSTVVSLDMQLETAASQNTETLSDPGHIASGHHRRGIAYLKVPSMLFADLPIAAAEPTERGLSLHQGLMEPETHLRRHSFSGLQTSYFQAFMSSQVQLENNMGNRFDRLHVEMDIKNKALQDQLVKMHEMNQELQLQLHEEQQKSQRELLEKQQQLLELQQQALDRLASIQSRVQAVITQTYELHEYPTPRLFIILPMEKRKRDKLGKPFRKLFRLFFLCECGAHTKMEGSKMEHHVHFAKHDGYDLEKPDEFFEKYGSYVLTMLQMVKYGFIAAGIVVPILGNLKLIESIDAVQQNLDLSNKTIGALVDESIALITDQTAILNGGFKISTDQMELESQEVLEGADFRQLQSYLSINDKGRILGNLYRIVTAEGYVKWVCMDHYHDVYIQSAINLLKDIVRTNKGSFNEEVGKVRVRLASSTLAAQFYLALTKAQCVQELAITLSWEVTKEDLQRFAAAVTKANVVQLELSGCNPGKQELDEVDSSLFQPILQLMSNGRIQIMDIKTSNKQFLHVDVSIMKIARKLRVLSFDGLTSVVGGRSTLINIIENCRALSTLSIKEGHANDVFQYIRRNLTSFRNLKTFSVNEVRYIVTLSLSQGKIDTIDASRLSPTYMEVEGLQELIMQGHLTAMSLKLDGADTDKDRYLAILQHNPKLRRITIPFYSGLGLDIIGWTVSARQDIIARGTPMQLRMLDLWKDIDTAINSCVLEFEDESSSFDLSTRIVLRSQRTYVDDNPKLFQEYGWSFMSLDAGSYTNADINNLAQLLDVSTGKAGSKLESIHLNLAALSCEGLESMDRVIARSYRLKYFRVLLDVDDTELRQKCEWLFGRQGTKLNVLVLQTQSSSLAWTSEIANMFPPRSQMPGLSIVDVSYLAMDEHAESFAHWIADIVAAPSPRKQQELLPSALESPLNGLALSVSKTDTWTPLQSISFQHVFIPLIYWNAIFKALDFTALSEVTFLNTNFTLKQFQTFVDCVPTLRSHEAVLPLEKLLFYCECKDPAEFDTLDNLVARLKLKAPRVLVTGLPDRPRY